MKIQKVTDPAFRRYGKVLEGYNFAIAAARASFEDTLYFEQTRAKIIQTRQRTAEELEALDVEKELKNRAFGGLPVQIGYCNGHNKKLNALEYHRNSEINVAVTDLVLLIGHQQDIEEDLTYDTSKVEAFLVPAGTGIEVYATTLHYAPCHVNESGFQCVVVLPRGTNTEIDFSMSEDGEDGLMTARNKWLIAHEDAKIEGAFNGLKGENITLD